MHRMIIMAGTIFASSVGFVLAGLVLREAIRNCRRQGQPRQVNRFPSAHSDTAGGEMEIASRGYDTPELAREDLLARLRETGSSRTIE